MQDSIKGGWQGHILRRIIHVVMIVVPWLYYWHGDEIAHFLGTNKQILVVIVLLCVIIFEIFRLRQGWIIISQRHYESSRLSAVCWTVTAIALLLLFTPEVGSHGAALSFPIIASLAVVDPLLGELRRYQLPYIFLVTAGTLVLILIWGISSLYFGTPLWWLLIVTPITLASELYKTPIVDDNFMMLIMPWIVVLFLYFLNIKYPF